LIPASPRGLVSPGDNQISSSRKDWAKLRVTMKQEKTQEGEEIQKMRAGPKD